MKQRIINYLLSGLLNAITIREIIGNNPKTKEIQIDGVDIRPDELHALQAEIKALEGFRIWKILTETTKSKAEERIFKTSMTIEDINFGKAMLYNLSLQKSIIDNLRNKLL